ncbi:MAG: molybdopterin oxidoreductase [SAR324 cluster bacterium]|nr:molybdopterin oxidoreductase [SAR324 cluster bacterium]
MKAIVEKSLFEIPKQIRMLLWALIGLGVLMFVVGLAIGDHEGVKRTWQTFLINVVFWGGLSQAGVIMAVIWQLTDSKWGRPFKRLAEAFGAFLPISFLMFIILFFGGHILYEWVEKPFLHHGVAVKAGWLNYHFFITRNIFWLLLMYGVSFAFIRLSLKPDFGFARTLIPGWGGTLADKLLKGYNNHKDEVVRMELLSRKVAPVLMIIYAIAGSFISWDFVMTLDQEWFSTLFAAFFMMGNLHAALGLLLIVAVTVRSKLGSDGEAYITINRIHDLAKLTFACAMAWTYLGFSQYIVIWYGDLSEETPFLIIRSMIQPWSTVFVIVILWLFVSVFLGLMPRTLCRTPNFVRAMGGYIALGQWFAVYLIVVPSLQEPGHYHVPFGFHEILITAGFGGAFALAYLTFLSKVPLLPVSDKHLCHSWHGR